MKNLFIFAIILVAAGSIYFFSQQGDDSTKPQEKDLKQENILISGTSWEYTAASLVDEWVEVEEGTQVNLTFTDENVTGSTGCNSFGASYSQEKDNLQFGPIASTEKACLGAITKQEGFFLESLSEVQSFEREGNQLRLSFGEDVELIFQRIEAETEINIEPESEIEVKEIISASEATVSPVVSKTEKDSEETSPPDVETKDDVATKTVTVGPELVDCYGEIPQQCMIVDGEYFYDEIAGFTYEEGFTYTLQVEIAELSAAATPADSSAHVYSLIKQLNKKPIN